MYVYIVTNKRNGTLYIGVTNDLVARTYQHRTKLVEGFTSRYGLDELVYYECYDDPENAIHREKRLKEWPRKWKLDLIEKMNPDWTDLYEGLCA
jgi:putative endonuclease